MKSDALTYVACGMECFSSSKIEACPHNAIANTIIATINQIIKKAFAAIVIFMYFGRNQVLLNKLIPKNCMLTMIHRVK